MAQIRLRKKDIIGKGTLFEVITLIQDAWKKEKSAKIFIETFHIIHLEMGLDSRGLITARLRHLRPFILKPSQLLQYSLNF